MAGWRVVSSIGGALLVLACSKPEKPRKTHSRAESTPVVVVDPADEAARVFERRCQICHGKDGKGDGPGSLTLEVKPRNYTDPAWQKSVRDEQIREIILEGGAAVGKDPGMPSTPELADQPEVLGALVKKIRSFAK